ncbi:SDR family NAD(P)-dependent oxidoreductase [Microbacterium sp. VKM Ac-2870]|uniref:SDR family NAD(P)-dependent oxidoreductase n=1 Tax=Microbacterium sp. VKM Ac-2870 TaxID=2783825 RepID=UPI00188B59AA|nr:SDR family NAD(P)-dependent oxidoreductase [Microbacterium sp. VKM Ac-2870]MBF4561177.1 SDR family NAD(P)-dependent oxidoreductase [Microbacterium sp. VKM Ac-2870]
MNGGAPVALITGAAGGLGTGMCEDLLERGWTVLAHVRHVEQGRKLAAAGAHLLPADLSSRAQVQSLVAQAQRKAARIDVLVNNAALGYGPPDATRQVTEDGVESRLAVNVLAPIAIMEGLEPWLGDGSRVLNVASINQELVDGNDLQLTGRWSREDSYRQSKALLLVTTQVFARRWKSVSVAVNAIHPGTRLPTKIVLESGVAPSGSLERGIETCVDQLLRPDPSTGMFVRVGDEPVRIDELYPSAAAGEGLVAKLREILA